MTTTCNIQVWKPIDLDFHGGAYSRFIATLLCHRR